eukprot:4056868-Alexandrium_andersonii.AAC.1
MLLPGQLEKLAMPTLWLLVLIGMVRCIAAGGSDAGSASDAESTKTAITILGLAIVIKKVRKCAICGAECNQKNPLSVSGSTASVSSGASSSGQVSESRLGQYWPW